GPRWLSCRYASWRGAWRRRGGEPTSVSGTHADVAGGAARGACGRSHRHGGAVALADTLPSSSSPASGAGLLSGAAPPEGLEGPTGAAPAQGLWGRGSSLSTVSAPARAAFGEALAASGWASHCDVSRFV